LYQLTDELIAQAIPTLCAKDSMFKHIYQRYGVPPLWGREENFATLVHIVLEQKVSLASASALMKRVESLCPSMQPHRFLDIDEAALRNAGLSGTKVACCCAIAQNLANGELSLEALRQLDDNAVIARLTRIRGIGPWTAGVYLMMALKRADAWASGDRALAVSYADCAALDSIPSYPELDAIAQSWQPLRAVAARMLWHAYLCKRHQSVPG